MQINEKDLDMFPSLKPLSSKEWSEAQLIVLEYPPKTYIFENKDAKTHSMFLLSGTARITLIDENGNESLLNVLTAGEVCGLLVLSGLSDRDYPGFIIAETDVKVLFVLKSSFLRWIHQNEQIRNAVFGSLLNGMLRMSEMLQERQSEPLNVRLIRALLRMSSKTQPLLYTTHRDLAAEIGSVREVVTRKLQYYQRKGWIETGRGWIQIHERSKLEAQLGD